MDPQLWVHTVTELKMEIISVFRSSSVQGIKHWTESRNPATLTAICHCHGHIMLIYALQNVVTSTFCIILAAAHKHIYIATTCKPKIKLNNIRKFRSYSQNTENTHFCYKDQLTHNVWDIIADDWRVKWWHTLNVLAVCEVVNEKGYGKYIYHRRVKNILSMNNKWQNTKFEDSYFERAQIATNTDKSETWCNSASWKF